MSRSSYSPGQPLYDQIVETYLETGSIKKACEKSGASEVTVRRVLITEGLWKSKTSLRIQELMKDGFTVKEIAEQLGVTVNAVQAYLPYVRGMYGASDSEDAKLSKSYRKRMSSAQEGVSRLSADEEEPPILTPSSFSESYFTEQEEISETWRPVIPPSQKILKLHLELSGSYIEGWDTDLGLRYSEKQELLSLAKARKGISRDILVPGNMNLHALHFVIQRLFGWQNEHMHHFSLSVRDFDKLTNGYFGSYVHLCGLIFRFPDDDLSDAYWDDDYTENISAKNWLRKKYQAPFKDESIGDTWLGNQWRIHDFKEHCPEIQDTDLLRWISREYMIEEEFNYLSERLTLGELLLPEEAPRDAVGYWTSETYLKEDRLKEIFFTSGTDEKELKDASEELRYWRKSRDQYDRMKWLYPDTYRKDVRKQTGLSYKELMEQHEEAISYETMRCEDLFHRWNITLDPYFSELYYSYDYGDDWAIKITVEDIYEKSPQEYPQWDGNALCIDADGLNLVEDCGGADGFLEMLRTINGDDEEEAQGMKKWAGSLGWTGRMSKPEKML